MAHRARTGLIAAILFLAAPATVLAQDRDEPRWRTHGEHIEEVASDVAQSMGVTITRTDLTVRASGGHGPEQRARDFVVSPPQRSRDFAQELSRRLGPSHMVQLEDGVLVRPPERAQTDYRYRDGEQYREVEHELTASSQSGDPDHVHAQADPGTPLPSPAPSAPHPTSTAPSTPTSSTTSSHERDREFHERLERLDPGDGATDLAQDVSGIACPMFGADRQPVSELAQARTDQFLAHLQALGFPAGGEGPRVGSLAGRIGRR